MGDTRIEMLTNDNLRFYPLLGPFLSRRKIVAELGFPVWDEDGKVWFVALDGYHVAGFAAVRFERETAVFCSDYVRPEYRRQGIHKRLIEERLKYVPDKAKRANAVVTSTARANYERHGFTAVSTANRSSRYTKMQREL